MGKRSADWLGHHNKPSDWSNPVGGVVCLGFYARKTWLSKRGGFSHVVASILGIVRV